MRIYVAAKHWTEDFETYGGENVYVGTSLQSAKDQNPDYIEVWDHGKLISDHWRNYETEGYTGLD